MGGKDSPAVVKAIRVDNLDFAHILLLILIAFAAATLIYQITITSVRYIRTLTCLNNDTQRFFRYPNQVFTRVKKHLLYAPLFNRRHSKQMHVGPVEMGILPTRIQSLLLAAIIVINIILCVKGIEWNGDMKTKLKHLRNRSGTLAVANMLPLFIISGRNNPLIRLLNVSFDIFNLLHRWFGRIVVSLVIVHSVADIWNIAIAAPKIHLTGFQSFSNNIKEAKPIMYGFIATVLFCVIIVQTTTAIRHAFYETFLHLHFALVAVVLACLWLHLEGLPHQIYIKIALSVWIIERLVRLISLIYRNVGHGNTRAHIETLPGDALRLTLRPARPWTFTPGQHIFLTIPSIGLWTSHPFSVAWSDTTHPSLSSDPEKGVTRRDSADDPLTEPSASVSLIIRRRAGFTDNLYRRTDPSGQISVRAFIEGPFGGHQNLNSYGTVLLFAGGVGITHQVPHVRHLVSGFSNRTTATRRILLVWVIQSPEHLEWIRPWMTTILAMPGRRDVLRIQLFVTRPRSTKEIHSPSATVQMFPGKPNVDTLVGMECEEQVGAMGVSVCGPGGLGDDVRNAVRRRQGRREIEFLEESFGW